MTQCWPLQGMSAPQKSVLISLADNANDDGVCWPSVARISERTCLSERAVRNAIRWLEDAKIIVSHQRNGRSTWYTVNPASYNPGTTCPPAPDAGPPRHDVPTTPAPDAPRTVREPSIEPLSDVDAPAPTKMADYRIPYEQIRETYNRVLGGKLQRCLGLSETHKKHIRGAYNLCLDGRFVVREGGMAFWEGLFNDVLDCPFMLGNNNRGWRADFEFLTTASKIQRFMEGKYDAA